MPRYNVIITGTSGFIGSALANKLDDSREYKVFAIPHDLLNYEDELKDLLHSIKPDYIFHLAAYGNHSTQTDEEETFASNVLGTWNLLQASRDIPYKAFINFGSSSEYGQKNTAMHELDLPEASTMYACTKVACTYLARAFAKKYNKPIVTVRPFSVFGPGEADHRFIPTVIKSLLLGNTLTLEPEAKHDWIYIKDFLEGLGVVTDNAALLSGQVVNIGSGYEVSNNTIVELLEYIAEKKAKIKKKTGMRKNDSQMWRADISKLKTFNWAPKVIMARALFETYQYYKNKYYGN